jgi:hypothetical protein
MNQITKKMELPKSNNSDTNAAQSSSFSPSANQEEDINKRINDVVDQLLKKVKQFTLFNIE